MFECITVLQAIVITEHLDVRHRNRSKATKSLPLGIYLPLRTLSVRLDYYNGQAGSVHFDEAAR